MADHEIGRPVDAYVGIVDAEDVRAAQETHSSQKKEGDPGASETAAKSFTAGNLGDGSASGLVPLAVQGQRPARGYDLNPRSGMISLDIPPGLVRAVPGGVTDFHVTVVYLGPDVDDGAFAYACDRARECAARFRPLTGSMAGISSFGPSEGSDWKVPAFVPVTLPGADDVRAGLEDLSASEHENWTPHVTLAYLDEGDPLPGPHPEVPLMFTHLSVHRGDEVRRFPFGTQLTEGQ